MVVTRISCRTITFGKSTPYLDRYGILLVLTANFGKCEKGHHLKSNDVDVHMSLGTADRPVIVYHIFVFI